MSSDNDLAVKQLNDFSVFLSYKMTWLMRQALLLPYKYDRVCLFCGNQCLAEGSKIFDPVTGESKEIQTITGSFHVEAWDGEKVVVAKANEPFSKGMDDIYKVSLENGIAFFASRDHIVMTSCGWRSIRELHNGVDILTPESNSPSSRSYIASIVEIGNGEIWDFEVPVLQNYIHNGVIHHNSGKSCYMAYSNVLKFLGSHPCPRKNVLFFECKNGHEFTRPAPWPGFHHFNVKPGDCFWTKNQNVMPKKIAFPVNMMCPECGEPIYIHKRGTTTFRMASENLPEDKEGSGAESAEIRNRTYPELKKWLPPFLLKRDITARTKAIIITNPNKGEVFGLGDKAVAYDGPDIVVEFVSYSQDVQSGAGSQRLAVSCDEEPGEAFWEEQLPRLIAENGEMQIFLTPAQKVTWTF